MILGLDCATKTGWAVCEGGKILESGVQDFTKKRGDSNGMMFLRYRQWLSEMLYTYKVSLCVYEQAHHRGGAATEICVNLTGRVQEECDRLKIEYATVHTGTLKKFATGSGSAKKPEIMAAAEKIIGRPPIDDNEADAIFISLWAHNEYQKENK